MKFRDKSIQYKISVMALVVIAIPLSLFYITITLLYNRAFENRSTQQIREDLAVMSDRIERVFNDVVLCSNYLTLNFNTIYQEGATHQVDIDNRVRSMMNQALLIFEGIDSIVYVDDASQMYFTTYDLYRKRDEILNSTYFSATRNILNGKTTLFDRTSDCMQRKDDRPVVTMGKRIVNIRTGEFLGYLFINLDVGTLEKSIKNEITHYYLFDSADNAIAASEIGDGLNEYISASLKSDDAFEMKKVRIDQRMYLIGATGLESGWTLVGVTDLRAYNITALQLFRTFLVAGVLITLLLIWLGMVLTHMITDPLSKLKDGAEEISRGNLDVQFHFESKDEIGRMGDIFNHMTKEISNLLQLVEEEARKKRTYELALVQQQVKPHFLYNTLDIIIILITMDRPKDAIRVTKKLADYYKNSLSSSMEIIPLEKEVRIIEDYLDLQLMRYQDKFTYDIAVDESLSETLIPKLTLQPLIENAIYHGLKYKEDWGNISVDAKPDGENVILTVRDNGVGMNEETVSMLKADEKTAGEHFGVYSVNHRLQLYYGERFNMDIQSTLNVGTTFTITIPKDWKYAENTDC